MIFKEFPSKVDFPELEKEIFEYWEKNNIVSKYLTKNKNSGKRFSFLDGPITANNPMAVHHGWGRTLKDFYQRYKNMKGFKQRFQNGFDNQGLWVEVEVEKKLGFKTKKDIENYGIDRFVEKCKEHTLHFAQIQTEQSKRLGYFMDWDHSYYTLSDENNYAIWHFLKVCHENNWLYKGQDVVPWCPRCGTAISQHEILTGDYADIIHKAVYIKYPVLNRDKEYLLVWTTTPWTLPANVAVAVNPKITYVRAETKNGEVFILAKSRLNVFDQAQAPEVLESFSGQELCHKNLRYLGPYDDLPIVKKSLSEHLLVGWEEGVAETEGTGLVHMSPGSGPEDYDVAKEQNLAIFPVLDESGFYLPGYGSFSGQNAAKIGPTVIEDLSKRDFIFKTEDFSHRYPLCWRCKTELLFRLVEEWYIKMDDLRERMIEATKKIRWIPDFGEKLELDWLKNMEDWLISKKRYWGLALPIWECQNCQSFEVIGSKQELKERAVEGWQEFASAEHSPHRPWVDGVKIKCSKCQKTISRILDVGNPWLDAGIVSFSTISDDNRSENIPYFHHNRQEWQKWFPADLVLECFPGQFKNWFYSLLATGAALENTNPFKTLLGHALVRDEKGREMHKSAGNAIEFNEAAGKMGADVIRWLYLRQNPEFNLEFGYGPAEEIKKQFLMILWNCYKFFLDYARTDFADLDQFLALSDKPSNNFLDKWIISRLNSLLKQIEQRIDDFDHSAAALAIQSFVVNDLSTWYIRRSRQRIGPRATNTNDKDSCYLTLKNVLISLTKVLSCFTPFLAEKLWQELGGKDTVHIQDWPELNSDLIDREAEEKMTLVRSLCSLGNALRKEVGIKIRQPLAKLKIKNSKLKNSDKEFLTLISQELNVINVEVVSEITPEMGYLIKEEQGMKIALNTEITPELKKQGFVREFVRTVQEKRKAMNLTPKDEIQIRYSSGDPIKELIEQSKQDIIKKVIARDLRFQDKNDFSLDREEEIGGEQVFLEINKIER